MTTLKHSYALNSAVALSLNTLHSSLSSYIYLCKNLSVLIVTVSEMGGQLNSARHSSTTVCDLTQIYHAFSVFCLFLFSVVTFNYLYIRAIVDHTLYAQVV